MFIVLLDLIRYYFRKKAITTETYTLWVGCRWLNWTFNGGHALDIELHIKQKNSFSYYDYFVGEFTRTTFGEQKWKNKFCWKLLLFTEPNGVNPKGNKNNTVIF